MDNNSMLIEREIASDLDTLMHILEFEPNLDEYREDMKKMVERLEYLLILEG